MKIREEFEVSKPKLAYPNADFFAGAGLLFMELAE
jgi:hypothetical protein